MNAEAAAGAGDPRDLRASDADRDHVAELLRDAAAEGRLSLDELDDRLSATYAAKTYRDLEPILHDLPGATGPRIPGAAPRPLTARPGPGPLPATRPGNEITRVDPGLIPTTSSAVAVFSGATWKGSYVLGPENTALALFGGVDIDLREARFTSPVVTITVNAIFGGVDIIVPDDVAVQVDGMGVFGAFDGPREEAPQDGERPLLRVTGLALFGGVDVKRKKPKRGFTQALFGH